MAIVSFFVLDDTTVEQANAVRAHLQELATDLQENGRVLPYGGGAAPEPEPPPPPKHDMRDLTNQQVINTFDRAFGRAPVEGAPAYIRAIGRAMPQAATNVLYGQRAALYVGPAVEDYTLSAAEKAALIAAL